MAERRLYDLINPSDQITFRATPKEAGVIAAIMGASLYFVRDIETGEDPSTEGALLDRRAIWSNADAIASYAKAWDSFLVGSPRDRSLFDEAVAKMTAEDAAAYRAKWHHEKRSSINDICQACWDAAARIAEEKPTPVVEEGDHG